VRLPVRRTDLFGFDPDFHRAVTPSLRRAAEEFFQVRFRVDGQPEYHGPVIFVANHAGFLPLDAVVIKTLLDPLVPGHALRPLLEDHVFTVPYVGLWLNRLGCVRASQDNAMRLIDGGESVVAFPEGRKGAEKSVFERDRIMRFGRGGLVRLALRTGLEVVPVGISGPELAYPLLAKLEAVGRFFGLPFLPVTPTFPLLGPLGLVPLPVRFSIVVGDPVNLVEAAGSREPDESGVLRANELIRSRVIDLARRAAE
jgi:1-acyl-sn-glycerol-3-phosphate acyltransferase